VRQRSDVVETGDVLSFLSLGVHREYLALITRLDDIGEDGVTDFIRMG